MQNAGSTKWWLHWGITRGSSLNLKWGKCGVWLVGQWVLISLCAFVCLTIDYVWRVVDIIILDACLVIVFIWDIDMLITLIDYLACLSIVTLILPWLFCSSHMYRLTVIYHSTWCVDYSACILSWSFFSMISLLIFILIAIFSFSLCVDMDDISALCLTACCMTALLLCDCMLLVYVGRTSIPLPPPPWFRSFTSFRFLHLQAWGLVCACFSNWARG